MTESCCIIDFCCCHLRKPKSLQLGFRAARLGDLAPGVLATAICRVQPSLTENTLFRLGGELLEVLPASPWAFWELACVPV